MRWLSNSMFAVKRSLQVSALGFNHCSSVCALKSPRRTLLAWYSGSGECQNDQSVYVISIDGLSSSKPLRIGNCTGNPVLIPTTGGKDAILLWSKFEDNDRYANLASRWKTCSLWTQAIGIRNDKITLLYEPECIAGPERHLLGRCNPLIYNGSILLPLYDEVNRKCVIFQDFKEIGQFGENMIQPTIWRKGNKICSLSRNFGSQAKKSQYCESTSGGITWTNPTSSDLWNLNNSVQVVSWHGEDVVLWNDTEGKQRKFMTLGVLEYKEGSFGFMEMTAKPIEVVGLQHGSYPSMCVDYDGNLNFSFTNAARKIEYHVWNYKTFKQKRDNPPRRAGTGTGNCSKCQAKRTHLL